MVSREIWINMHSRVFQRLQIAVVLRTRAILRPLKNSLVHVISMQIALEIMLLPIRSLCLHFGIQNIELYSSTIYIFMFPQYNK